MKLYINGCSHTRGTDLSMGGNTKLAYPYLLADYYDAELINESILGSSNDRIVRMTMESILNMAIPPDKVVIQFTHLDRFDTGNITHTPRSIVKRNDPSMFGYDFYKEYFPKNEIVNKHLSHKLLNQMYTLQLFLIEYGISDYRFMVWQAVDSEYITYKHLDKTKIIFNTNALLGKKFKPCDIFDKERNKIDGHYGVDAHAQISEWIIDNYSSTSTIDKYEPLEHVYT
jgi:hypothetical protein